MRLVTLDDILEVVLLEVHNNLTSQGPVWRNLTAEVDGLFSHHTSRIGA